MVTCTCGLRIFVAPTVASFRCPKCRSQLTNAFSAEAPERQLPYIEPTETPQQHWALLHRYAFAVPNWTQHQAAEWYQAWTYRIPNLGCDCRQHWRELVTSNPPDFSTSNAFFRWTVARHNDVNARLGKPIMPLDHALALYSPKSPSSFF